jgi:IS1 family transposase
MMMVSRCLWLAGVVSQTRDCQFADRLLAHVRVCSGAAQAVTVATDGWAAYPKSIQRASWDKVKTTAGRGRAQLQVWKQLCIVTGIKHTEKKHVVEVTRIMTRGSQGQAQELMQRPQGGAKLNTSFIKRVNGTVRERLAILTRKSPHTAQHLAAVETAMYLLGTTYNVCFPHQALSKSSHLGYCCTPAMAAGLTDHVWSILEVLSYRVPSTPCVASKRCGRPRRQSIMPIQGPRCPRGRPCTRPLPDPTLLCPNSHGDGLASSLEPLHCLVGLYYGSTISTDLCARG